VSELISRLSILERPDTIIKTAWTTKRIGDVAKTQYGLSEPMNQEGKGYKIFRMGEVQGGRLIDTGVMKYADIDQQEFSQYKLQKNDILFNRTNSFELVGKTGLFDLDGDYCFASYLVRLKLDHQTLIPEFLNYLMNSAPFQASVKSKASQSINQANINATILSNEEISFPISLQEQRRIVTTLDEVLGAIAIAKANAEVNLRNTLALFAGELNFLLTSNTASWNEKAISDVCRIINGRAYKQQELLSAGKYPVLRVGNFFTNKHWYYSDLELDDDKYCDGGDLLYAWSASFGPRIWTGGKVIYHYHIWKVIPDVTLIERDFLRWFFEWDVEQIKSAQGTGTTMMHVGKGSMDARVILVPDLATQRRIVTAIQKAERHRDDLMNLYERKLSALEELKQSLLSKAFSGNL